MIERRWEAVYPENASTSAQDWGQFANYPKGLPFPTKRFATSMFSILREVTKSPSNVTQKT
jgi:hypothetical protein